MASDIAAYCSVWGPQKPQPCWVRALRRYLHVSASGQRVARRAAPSAACRHRGGPGYRRPYSKGEHGLFTTLRQPRPLG